MKKLYAVFLLVLFLLLCISCNESKKNSRYIGQYQAVYVSPAKDMPYANIDLDIHSFQDTLRAKMAIHHYYKDNLLYSELTNECAPDFNKDTLIFHFSMQDEEMGGDLKECEREQRELCLKFKRDQDSLVLLSSSDDDILPDDFLVFRKAATSEDSAAIIVEKIYPRFTIAGIYYVSGPIKRLKTKETEYFFDEKGVLVHEDKPAVYIYEEEFNAYNKRSSVKGIIARVKVEEFSKGVILPHEFTLSKAKTDRFNLMKATNCNFSQIYALYMDEEHTTLKTIDALSKGDPDQKFTDNDHITHKLWIITDEKVIQKLTADFADRKLYIADGHHRYETALNYRDYCRANGISKEGDPQDYQMIYLVDMQHPGLVVFPTHRMVRDLENFDRDEVLRGCEEYFDIKKFTSVGNINSELGKQYKQGNKAFGFYCGKGEWYLLVLKDIGVMSKVLPDLSPASQQLDVSVLHSLILEKTMGIDKENMANQINLTYTKFFEEAIMKVDRGEFQCSFILNPTRVTEIRDVAAAGEKMPQKSTYFYPKMITGMVMNDLNK